MAISVALYGVFGGAFIGVVSGNALVAFQKCFGGVLNSALVAF